MVLVFSSQILTGSAFQLNSGSCFPTEQWVMRSFVSIGLEYICAQDENFTKDQKAFLKIFSYPCLSSEISVLRPNRQQLHGD